MDEAPNKCKQCYWADSCEVRPKGFDGCFQKQPTSWFIAQLLSDETRINSLKAQLATAQQVAKELSEESLRVEKEYQVEITALRAKLAETDAAYMAAQELVGLGAAENARLREERKIHKDLLRAAAKDLRERYKADEGSAIDKLLLKLIEAAIKGE